MLHMEKFLNKSTLCDDLSLAIQIIKRFIQSLSKMWASQNLSLEKNVAESMLTDVIALKELANNYKIAFTPDD